METSKDVYSKHKIIVVTSLKIMEFFGYIHLEEITVRRQDDKLYKFREGDFKRLRREDIEDMLLLLVQGKLTNLNVDERFALNVALRMYTLSVNRCGFENVHKMHCIIYQDDMDRNRLMRIDELHKFSDDTLNHVRTSLNDIATGIQIEYLPKRKWLNLVDPQGFRGNLKMVVKRQSIKVKEFQRSFRHSDTERLSQSDEVLKLKNFKKDATLKLFKSTNQERFRYEDLVASISVMPYSLFKRLGLGSLKPIKMIIEMADRSMQSLKGIKENVLVKISNFVFPIDFVILDIMEDENVPIILGRPMLATAHAKIDAYELAEDREDFSITLCDHEKRMSIGLEEFVDLDDMWDDLDPGIL
ncbi:copia protein, partial [Tanacetum coccineum]